MAGNTRVLYPRLGWAMFQDSKAVTAYLWERCRDWRYMNPTSGTSIWESPDEPEGSIYVAYQGEDIVELVIELGGSTVDVASELAQRYDLLFASSGSL